MACEFFFGYHHGYVSLYWFNYNGLPFILSVLVFVLVRQIHVPDSVFWNVLVKWAPYSFGVYLIHDQLLVRDWLWSNKSIASFCDQWIYPLVVLGLCILIFLSCAFADSIRKRMFAWLGIDVLFYAAHNFVFYIKHCVLSRVFLNFFKFSFPDHSRCCSLVQRTSRYYNTDIPICQVLFSKNFPLTFSLLIYIIIAMTIEPLERRWRE